MTVGRLTETTTHNIRLSERELIDIIRSVYTVIPPEAKITTGFSESGVGNVVEISWIVSEERDVVKT